MAADVIGEDQTMPSQQLDADSTDRRAMRIYIFKSETRKNLRAFAAEPQGAKLPERHGPWTVIGIIGPSNPPPHKISRAVIEKAIGSEGFQLWRLIER
jgi:hypothetical protein